ncbi:MAG: hypothetical protein JJT75_06635 [Opitutales bacterium]|nr:hypothetical protein [Opitutales bacterium]MCH8541779.1 hypothetical protein [Opitutales bacterium]
MSKHPILSLLAFFGLAVAMTAPVQGANFGETEEFHLALEDALFVGDGPGDRDRGLLLWVSRHGEDWERVWGISGSFNRSHHTGRVVTSRSEDDTLFLTLEMNIRRDPWVQGGVAVYEVELSPAEKDGYEGHFTGSFRGKEVEGKASGDWLAVKQGGKPGITAAELGEHPRLLFRQEDLPELRKRMDTPLGKAAMERMTNAAGLAFKYQLTGNADYAEQARELVVEHMADTDAGSKGVRGRVWGWRLEQVALAYDMCYDAWDAEFRREVEAYAVRASNRILNNPSVLHGEIKWHMASTYPGTIYYGGAMAALAMLGETGPEPQKPSQPLALEVENGTIRPADDYQPGDGVPVVDFADDEMSETWIFAAVFRPRDTDHLGDLGGVAAARPELGTTVTYEDQSVEFITLEENQLVNNRYTGNRTKVDVTKATNREWHSKSYYYHVLRNDQPRWVQLITDSGARIYINGVRVQERDYFRLEEGLYPMMVQLGIGETNDWGLIAMEPRLREVSEEEAQEGIERAQEDYERSLAVWQLRHDQWKRYDGADVSITRLFERTRMMMRLNYLQGIGSGGSQGSDQFPMGHEGPHKYATAYLNTIGRDVTGRDDVSHYLPFKMFSRVYQENGDDLMQEIVGEPDLWIRDTYHETRDLTSDFFATMFPLLPTDWQPTALWFWNRHLGASGPEDYEKILHRPGRPYEYAAYDTHPLWVFANYPMEMEPKAPVETMPLTWSAPQFGYYGFRNGWEDDAFLVQVWGKAFRSGSGGGNAGVFRIAGFGEHWSQPGTFRFGENLVLLPYADFNRGALGKIVHSETHADGSGVVTIDMDDVYAGSTGEGMLYEDYGSLRRPETFTETGLSGLRSIGVDYSGKSGAPALIVIVDKIAGVGEVEGADQALWAWQLDSGWESAGRARDVEEGTREHGVTWRGEVIEYNVGQVINSGREDLDRDDVSVEGQHFRIAGQNGAHLQGTFVTPGNVEMRFEERWNEIMRYKRNVRKDFSKALFAEGEGEFFCIITIQEGKAPEVIVEGEGLDATVRVGDRTIRFDGTKVVFE